MQPKLYNFLLILLTIIVLWLFASLFIFIKSDKTIFNINNSHSNILETGFEQDFIKSKRDDDIGIRKYNSIVTTDNVILYLHGNAGRLGYIIPELQKAGTVYSPSYPGYSESEGKASMPSLYEASILAYDYLVKVCKIDEKNIVIFGHSLGGSIATYLASQKPNAKRLVLVNTFSSIQSMCWRKYSILSIFMNSKLNSAKNATKVTIPVTQLALVGDQTVPYEEGQKLYTYFTNSKDKKFVTQNRFTHTALDWELILPELL